MIFTKSLSFFKIKDAVLITKNEILQNKNNNFSYLILLST